MRKSVVITALLLLVVMPIVGGYLYLQSQKPAIMVNSASTPDEHTDQSAQEVAPVGVTQAELKAQEVNHSTSKVAPRKRKLVTEDVLVAPPQQIELVLPVPEIQTLEDVTSELRKSKEFQRAIKASICLALNDFDSAAGTLKITIVAPWKGGEDHVIAKVVWDGDLLREFSDHELTDQERTRAAAEVERTLERQFDAITDSDVFPAMGGRKPARITIVRHFEWSKSSSTCNMVAKADGS